MSESDDTKPPPYDSDDAGPPSYNSDDEGPPSYDEGPSSSDEEPSSSDEGPSSYYEGPSSSEEEPYSYDEGPSSSEEEPYSYDEEHSSSEEEPYSSDEELSSSSMPPSQVDSNIEHTIADLNSQIDEVIGLYKGLKDLDMGTPKKKNVGMKVAALKINKSKVRSGNLSNAGEGPSNAGEGPSEDHFLSSKSELAKITELAKIDLHYYLIRPAAWSILTDEEKATIRSLLPENTPFNEDGSPSTEFFKYNPDWRNAIREVREDILSGRLDPKWQADAAQAMEERAAGDFDAFKEQEYEQFWGQKQKVSSHAVAGKSSKVTLGEMVSGDVFTVGDVWSYARSFGSGVLVEKDCTIGQIRDDKLVFLVPPANHKIMPAHFAMDLKAAKTAKFYELDKAANGSGHALIQSPTLGLPIEHSGTFYDDGTTSAPTSSLVSKHQPDKGLPAKIPRIFAVDQPGKFLGEPEIHLIGHPQLLERRIVDLDGRLDANKALKNTNSWKYFRCHRDNQDIGSLLKLREEYHNRHG